MRKHMYLYLNAVQNYRRMCLTNKRNALKEIISQSDQYLVRLL